MDKCVNVGTFDGNPVFFNPVTDIVYCKDVTVYLRSLIAFKDSDKIRANLDSQTSIIKTGTTYKIGCLEDTNFKFKQLINIAVTLKTKINEKQDAKI